jgi:hypothetical protein
METFRIRDGKKSAPRSGSRDKHPGSATLPLTFPIPVIPSPVFCVRYQSAAFCFLVPCLLFSCPLSLLPHFPVRCPFICSPSSSSVSWSYILCSLEQIITFQYQNILYQIQSFAPKSKSSRMKQNFLLLYRSFLDWNKTAPEIQGSTYSTTW